jgi:hypothetical protein
VRFAEFLCNSLTPTHGIMPTAQLLSDQPNMPTPTTPPIQTTLRNLTRSALDLLFPIHCVGCEKEGEVVCELCVDGLRKLEQPFCDTCAQPGVQGQCGWCQEHPSNINGIRAPYLFEGPVREAVHRLKWSFLPREKPACSCS